jgi:hypothetical protein
MLSNKESQDIQGIKEELEGLKELANTLIKEIERLNSGRGFFEVELIKLRKMRDTLQKEVRSQEVLLEEIMALQKLSDKRELYQTCEDVIELKKRLSKVSSQVLTKLLGKESKKPSRKEIKAQNLAVSSILREQLGV